MNELIVFGAQYLWLGIIIGSVGTIYLRKDLWFRLGAVLVLSLPIAYVAARLLGTFYSHVQPFAALGFTPLIPHEIDNAFPSDHTLIAGVFSSVAFLADRRFGLVAWALTLVVGLSRMLAGLHWGEDVLAAAALAVATVAAVDFVVRKVRS